MRMTRARLCAGLGLLVVATSASAERAWVLRVTQGTKVDHLFASYVSAKDCIAELDRFD